MRPLDAKGRDDYYRRVADVLIAQVKAGTAPWVQSWQPGERGRPYNLQSGKSYRGGNSTWLASVAQMRGYQDERWGTYRQIAAAGGQVRRGQKGASIIYWQWERPAGRARDGSRQAACCDEEGQPGVPSHDPAAAAAHLRLHGVQRRAGQRAAAAAGQVGSAGHEWERNERVEKLLPKNCGAEVRARQPRPCVLRPGEGLDRDAAPRAVRRARSATTSRQLHELGPLDRPSGAHEPRIAWSMGSGRARSLLEYSREELRAEISAMISGDRLDVGHDGARSRGLCRASGSRR